MAAHLINQSGVSRVIVDSPDVDTRRYADMIARLSPNVEIIAEHGADAKYPVVSAASIVAKVERDWIIRRMEEVYGRIGTGYPHDEETLRFMEFWMKRFRRSPSFIRSTWRTTKALSHRIFQRKIDDFI